MSLRFLVISLILAISTDCFAKEGILVWKLEAKAQISSDVVDSITGFVVAEVEKQSNQKVLSDSDIQTILEGEEKRQKCSGEETSCIVELGVAMGARESISGNLGKVGKYWLINLKRIDVYEARVVKRISKRVKGDIDQLFDIIPTAIAELLGKKVSADDYAEYDEPKEKNDIYDLWKKIEKRTKDASLPKASRIDSLKQFLVENNMYNPFREEAKEYIDVLEANGEPGDKDFISPKKMKNHTEWVALRTYVGGGMFSPTVGAEMSFFTLRWNHFYWEMLRAGGGIPFIGYWGTSFGVPFHIGESAKNEIRFGMHLTMLYGFYPIPSGCEILYVRHAYKYFSFEAGARLWAYPTAGTAVVGIRI